MIRSSIISSRYLWDGLPLESFSPEQAEAWRTYRSALSEGILNEIQIQECFLCKSKNGYLIAEKDRYGNKLRTVVCQKCGIIRSFNQLDEKSTAIFYKDIYRQAYGDNPTQERLLSRMERSKQDAANWIDRLNQIKLNPSNLSIFEVGAGGGWNLLPLKMIGANVLGCDYGSEFISLGQRYGIPLFNGGLDDFILENPASRFDVILLIEVLEHTQNPLEFLNKCKKILKVDGHIIIGVPPLSAGYSWWKGDFLSTLQNAHNYLFDIKSLTFVLNAAGFEFIQGDRLIEAAVYRLNASTQIPSRSKRLPSHRGLFILWYVRWLEWVPRFFWNALKKAGPASLWKDDSYRLRIWLLRLTAPDIFSSYIKSKVRRLIRKIKLES